MYQKHAIHQNITAGWDILEISAPKVNNAYGEFMASALQKCRTRNLEEKKKGLAAKDRLEEIIASFGENFLIKTQIDKKGKYGRILGEIFSLDKKSNANQMLLSEGHAVEYFGGKK